MVNGSWFIAKNQTGPFFDAKRVLFVAINYKNTVADRNRHEP